MYNNHVQRHFISNITVYVQVVCKLNVRLFKTFGEKKKGLFLKKLNSGQRLAPCCIYNVIIRMLSPSPFHVSWGPEAHVDTETASRVVWRLAPSESSCPNTPATETKHYNKLFSWHVRKYDNIFKKSCVFILSFTSSSQ